MKKLQKSEICGSVNSERDPHVTKNWLKSQTFRLKTKTKMETHLGNAKRASQTYLKKNWST